MDLNFIPVDGLHMRSSKSQLWKLISIGFRLCYDLQNVVMFSYQISRHLGHWFGSCKTKKFKGPSRRSDFRDPFLGSEIWKQAFRRSDFKVPFLLAPFIFQEECRMKIEHVLFPSLVSELQIRVSEGHF